MNSHLQPIVKILISWFAAVMLASCGGGDSNNHSPNTKLLAQGTKVLAQSVTVVTPQSGWWWNPAEGGRGFTLEVQNGKMFMAGYLYDPSGRASWYAAGPTAMSGSTFAATLTSYNGGQSLTGAYHAVTATASSGNISIVFTDSSHGTMTWPGGVVPIERFNIVSGGATTTQSADTPEAGWWWNAAEGGRGYSIEIQNGTMFLAGYMYDNAGNPIWYASGPTAMTNASTYQGTWQQYGNGQTLAGAYKSASVVNSNVGTVSVVFSDRRTATMTLPNGTIIPLTRYDFNGLPLAPAIPTTTIPLPVPTTELTDTLFLPAMPALVSPASAIVPSSLAANNFLAGAFIPANYTIVSFNGVTVDCPAFGKVVCPGFERLRFDAASNKIVSDVWAFEPVKQKWTELSSSGIQIARGDLVNSGNGWGSASLILSEGLRSDADGTITINFFGGLTELLHVSETPLTGTMVSGSSNLYSANAKSFRAELEQAGTPIYSLKKTTGFWTGSDDATSYGLLAAFRASHAITSAPFCMQNSIGVLYGIVFNPVGKGAALYHLSGICTRTIVGAPVVQLDEGVTTVNGRKVIVLSGNSLASTPANNQFSFAIALDAGGVANEGYKLEKHSTSKLSGYLNRDAILDFMKAGTKSFAATLLP